MIPITLVPASRDIFCLLLPTAFVLLTFAAAFWYYRKLKVDDADVVPSATPSAEPPVANNASPPVVTNMTATVPVTLHRVHQLPPMPTIPEETLHELVWASFEEPACQQLKCLVQPTITTSAVADSCDASIIKSGEPPPMLVTCEETEEDLKRDNFRVVLLTGKDRPPPVPDMIEEMEEDRASWTPLDCPPSPQQVQPTAEPVVSTGSKCSASSPETCRLMKITRGVYKGSSCSVIRSTAKMVEVQLLGESKTRKIKKSSLSRI